LEAVAEIRKKQSVKLKVIGEPKKNGIITKLMARLGIGDIVHFTGRIQNEEFADYYAKSTIAVVPSLYEGFGIPAVEAMACGVPLITTSGGALPEVVGDAAMIVPPADAAALAKAISFLFNNTDQRKKYAQAGLERVNSVFSWPKAAQKVVDIYREAIDGHRRFS
jgi:glycosyltransferase involved in cell wall biosynthesis